MNLLDLVSTPTVTEIQLDDKDIIEAYGEPLSFNIVLPIPLNEYVGLSKLVAAEFVKLMLVDKDGNKLLTEGKSLSAPLIGLINNRIWLELGKLPEKCLTPNPKKST